jgi:hypothetical protein
MPITGAWKWKVKLTIDYTKVSSDQVNFPVPLVWSGAAGSSNIPSDALITGGAKAAKSDGGDIRFSSDVNGQNELAFEIVQWTQNAAAASARAEIHVKILSLSSSVNTVLYMFWGNSAASGYAVGDTYGRNAAWSNSYIWVSHCNESSGSSMVDSSGNKNAVYKSAMPTRQGTGPLLSSQRFSNVANKWADLQAYDALGFSSGTQNHTLMAVMVRNTSAVYQGIFQKNDGATSPGNLSWQWYASNQPTSGRESQYWRGNLNSVFVDSSDTTGTTSAANFNHLCYTYNHINGINYIDASAETIITSTGNTDDTASDSCEIGNWNGNPGSDQLRADVDELRIANTARTAGWITTEKNAILSLNTFLSPGSIVDAFPRGGFAQYVFQVAGVRP